MDVPKWWQVPVDKPCPWGELAINEPLVRLFNDGFADYEQVAKGGIGREPRFNKRTGRRIL